MKCKFPDVFQGVGCFEGTVQIDLKDNAVPYQAPPRRVPVALQKDFKHTLDKMVQDQILKPLSLDERSEWCNSFVAIPKPRKNEVRICIDPAKLNEAIIRPVHRGQTVSDILANLAGAKYFSLLDARSGFWNLKLDDKSSRLTTFACMFGRYRYLRLPFGLSCSSDLFQKKVDETFVDLRSNVMGIADDILVVGFSEDRSDHDLFLECTLQRCQDVNLKLNPDKCIFHCTNIPFFGERVSRFGVKPDPAKLAAITGLQKPMNKKEMQSFLGMINYISKYSPEVAQVCKPLRELISVKSDFKWHKHHTEAFENAKKLVSKDCCLRFYDSELPLYMEMDASKVGLGAALLQPQENYEYSDQDTPPTEDLRPVAYASKSLTSAESNYSNIEHEALGVVHGLEKFHHYCYGRQVNVITDHKPLLSLLKKDVSTASPRLQRLLLRIHRYRVSMTYRPGKDMHLADFLSRSSHQPNKDPEIEGFKLTINDLTLETNCSITSLMQIQEATKSDPVLNKLAHTVQNGWPEHRSNLDEQLIPYWNFREEIALTCGLLVKGTRIIVPEGLRQEILTQLHYSHLGIEKTRLLARGAVYWPNINADIELAVKSCIQCQENQSTKSPDVLIPHEIPHTAWSTLGMDVFYINKMPYLCIIDYLSKFPVIHQLGDHTAECLIDTCKDIFSEYGIPRRIMSDAGSNFNSQQFISFCRRLDISTSLSSSYHHSSNGQVENCIKLIKRTFKKCISSNKDPRLAMLQIHTMNISDKIPSPAELLGRKIKGLLPCLTDMSNETVQEALMDKQTVMKNNFDQKLDPKNSNCTDYPIGSFVMIQKEDTGPWTHGTIIAKTEDPNHNDHSYKVKVTLTGRVITRNIKHMRWTFIPDWAFKNQNRKDTDTDQDKATDKIDKIMEKVTECEPNITNRQDKPMHATPRWVIPPTVKGQALKPVKAKGNADIPVVTQSGCTVHAPKKLNL